MRSEKTEELLQSPRPPQIVAAVLILLLSVAIGCAYALHLLTVPSMAVLPVGIVVASMIVAYALLKRQRWARILLLIVTLLGGLALAVSFMRIPVSHKSAMTYAIRGLQSVLRFIAVYLLFTEAARRWFRRTLA